MRDRLTPVLDAADRRHREETDEIARKMLRPVVRVQRFADSEAIRSGRDVSHRSMQKYAHIKYAIFEIEGVH